MSVEKSKKRKSNNEETASEKKQKVTDECEDRTDITLQLIKGLAQVEEKEKIMMYAFVWGVDLERLYHGKYQAHGVAVVAAGPYSALVKIMERQPHVKEDFSDTVDNALDECEQKDVTLSDIALVQKVMAYMFHTSDYAICQYPLYEDGVEYKKDSVQAKILEEGGEHPWPKYR